MVKNIHNHFNTNVDQALEEEKPKIYAEKSLPDIQTDMGTLGLNRPTIADSVKRTAGSEF